MAELTYSFFCPNCHSSLKIGQAMEIAAGVLTGDYDGEARCPSCRFTITWAKPGQLQGKQWWELLREAGVEYLPHPCLNSKCGRMIEGGKRKKYCSMNCRQSAYYYRRISTVSP
jgi:hypothetical protein